MCFGKAERRRPGGRGGIQGRLGGPSSTTKFREKARKDDR